MEPYMTLDLVRKKGVVDTYGNFSAKLWWKLKANNHVIIYKWIHNTQLSLLLSDVKVFS